MHVTPYDVVNIQVGYKTGFWEGVSRFKLFLYYFNKHSINHQRVIIVISKGLRIKGGR